MNEDLGIKEAARERLFDALLAEAVAVEVAAAGGAAARTRGRHLAMAAVVLLAAFATIGVALLARSDRGDEAQDPNAFDPLFPRVEREFHLDRLPVQLRSMERVRQLPDGPLPPLAALPSGSTGDGPVPVDIVDALAARRGVRSLTVGGDAGLPHESWRRIAAMPDLEVLTICCDIDVECMRELRRAPRLRALGLGKIDFRISPELMRAVLEVPRLDCVQLVWQELPSSALRALAGSPELRALNLEGCVLEPDWIDALGELRELRWLQLTVGRWQQGTMTGEDLRRIGRLPRLLSLGLAKVDIAAADYAALPPSLAVLRLPDPLPAAVVRELLARPLLRGLELRCRDSEAEAALCELLPTTKLERLGCDAAVGEQLWAALGRMPRLRHLSFSSRDVANDLQRVVGLKALEHLQVQASVPDAATLRRLRDLPALRRVVFCGTGDGSEYRCDLAAMQEALSPHVDLIVR